MPSLEIPEDPPVQEIKNVRRLWIAKSRTRVGHIHCVVLTEDGQITCTCEGYQFTRHCWAINIVKETDDDFTVSL